MINRETLKQWFLRGKKPTAAQFAAWIDSYWHKDEKLPISSVEQLVNALSGKQEKTDNMLETESKEIVPAINEVNEKYDLLNDKIMNNQKLEVVAQTAQRINETITEISRYWNIREEIQIFTGWLSGAMTVYTTQIRGILEKKFHVGFTIQAIDTVTKKVFYATGVLAATPYGELDQQNQSGTFDKSDDIIDNEITFELVSGGVQITPDGNTVITSILAS